jgi:hypothetical protein
VPSHSSLPVATIRCARESSSCFSCSSVTRSETLSAVHDTQEAISFRSKNRSMYRRSLSSSSRGSPAVRTRSRYAWRKNLTSPRKIPRGIPSRRRLRASATPNAESPSLRPTSPGVSEGGEGSARNAWSREPDSPRSVAAHSSGGPGTKRR